MIYIVYGISSFLLLAHLLKMKEMTSVIPDDREMRNTAGSKGNV
jgi:hypothetical protein